MKNANATGGNISHDPLCAAYPPSYYFRDPNLCTCQLIRAVRADERARWQPRLPVVAGHPPFCWCETCGGGE